MTVPVDLKEALWEEFVDDEFPDQMDFRVEKVEIQEGLSFSKEAIDDIMEMITLFVGARMMARWNRTTTPPSMVTITVNVETA